MTIFKFSLKDTWNRYSVFILGTFGVVLLCFYYGFKYRDKVYFNSHPNGFKELFQIAVLVLGSGIFLATLKWYQFKGFIREELQAIINSSEFEKKVEKMLSDAYFSEEFLKKQS